VPKRSFDELIDVEDVLAEDLQDPEFKAEWDRLAAARVVAELVAETRVQKGLSQTALARLAGVSQPVIARIESGEHSPTIETLIKLANALDIELVVGITPAQRKKALINVPARRAKSVSETTAALGSHLVISAA
jgi:transcriptional regulator with XRE-family HTH domain